MVCQVGHGYIRVQEVPKTADYAVKNTFYIFEAKIEDTCASATICSNEHNCLARSAL